MIVSAVDDRTCSLTLEVNSCTSRRGDILGQGILLAECFELVPNTLPGSSFITVQRHDPDVSSARRSYPNQAGGGLNCHQLGARLRAETHYGVQARACEREASLEACRSRCLLHLRRISLWLRMF
jgi:hypothetical protein